ncbi:hypothetical protein L7F22_067970 [Adiantum nelumboides]|nr:hypothetical protein [Adiantum nelumboides]
MKESSTLWFKLSCLLTLTVHTSLAAIIMHRSRTVPQESQYSAATSVLLGEVMKMLISSIASVFSEKDEYRQEELDSTSFFNRYKSTLRSIMMERNGWQLCIPAGLYVCQNFFQIIAVTTISPLVYQSVSQSKILVVAVLSILLMGRKLSIKHWSSILVLLFGIQVVRFYDNETGAQAIERPISSIVDSFHKISQTSVKSEILFSPSTRGTFLLLLATTFGGLAAVSLERLMKKKGAKLWYQNTQLSFFSFLPAAALVVYDCYKTGDYNFMRNFGFWPWMTVLTRAAGGIVVALVIRYTDNILKSFATSSAIVLSLLVGCLVNVQLPSIGLLLGTLLVITSTLLFAYADKLEKQAKINSNYLKEQQDLEQAPLMESPLQSPISISSSSSSPNYFQYSEKAIS